MNIRFRQIHNVLKSYNRQAGKKISWQRPSLEKDRVSISEEGKNMLIKFARRFNQEKISELEIPEKKFKFKVLDVEKGKEEIEEISQEEQSYLLERVVAKIMQAKGVDKK